MKRLLGILIGIFLCTLAQAKLTVHVEPEKLQMGETCNLIITDDTTKIATIPNLTGLQDDFTILGTERSVNYAIVNGQTSTVSQWVIMMRPKKSGTLVIPPIPVGLQTTDALAIKVQNNHNTTQPTNQLDQKDILLITEVDNDKPYINQQVIYTVKIYNSRRLLDTQYQPPETDNALMIPLGDTQSYQTVEQGKTYAVEEQRYAIFPQKSGAITVKPPVFTALTYDVTPTQIKTQNKPIVLTIKSAPNNVAHSKDWLPAKNINLSENYDNSQQNFKQDSTLVRTITLEAIGVPAQFLQNLPALNVMDKQQFNIYPEPLKQNNIVRNGDIVGTVTLKVTYLLNKAGHIIIPELRIPWFNIATGKAETAVLPPHSLEIKASSAAQKSPAPAPLTASPPAPVSAPVVVAEKPTVAWILVALFAIAWLVTLALWLWQKYAALPKQPKSRPYLAKIQQACTNNNPRDARDALLCWAKLQWPETQILNLMDLITLVHDIDLKRQLQILSKVLYSKDVNKPWSGEALWLAVKHKTAKPANQKSKANLPPLNLINQ